MEPIYESTLADTGIDLRAILDRDGWDTEREIAATDEVVETVKRSKPYRALAKKVLR